jgi:hypothetical protein
MGTSLATPKGEKLEEMFDPASRLITYITKRDATNSPSISTEDLLGFAVIRFDTEDTLDSQEYEDGVRTTVVYMCVRGSSTSLEADCVVQIRNAGIFVCAGTRHRRTAPWGLRIVGKRHGYAEGYVDVFEEQ